MNFRLAEPAHLIDINFIGGMDYIRSEKDAIKIGCLARQSRALSDALVRQRCPLLAAALTHVGYEQTRNRGTLCGSLAHADPAAELPAVLLALDGSLKVGNSTRKREIAARDFFQSYLTTALANDEMVLEASVPEQPARSGSSFVEFARRFGDFAIVGVAVSLVFSNDEITDARIALTGVGDKPWRERGIEEILIGKKAMPELFNKAAGEIAANIDPSSDIHGSAAYRKSLANVLTRRALNEALQKARIGDW
jgi:carbon-monoxide dehydrogenase medium subunit